MPRDRNPGKRSGVVDFATTWGGAALVVLIGFVVAYQFVQPAPPERISIATGGRDGAYYHYAMQYRCILARNGITLELVETAGSLENLERLTGDNGGVDLAMVQGGIPAPTDNIAIESIGSLFYEPVWILTTDRDLPPMINAWRGKRIAVGPPGSGTRFVSLDLLRVNGIDDKHADLAGEDLSVSASALVDGGLDILFMVAAPQAPLLRELIGTRGVDIVNLQRTGGVCARRPFAVGRRTSRGDTRLHTRSAAGGCRHDRRHGEPPGP